MIEKQRDALWRKFREEHGPLPGGRGFQESYRRLWAQYQHDRRNDLYTDEDGKRYMNATPTWEQILPTWRTIVESCMGSKPRNIDPAKSMEEFWGQMRSMARAADKWNEHVNAQLPEEPPCPHDGGWDNGERGMAPGPVVTQTCRLCGMEVEKDVS